MLHWNLCKKYHLPAADKWWEHKVEKVLRNDDVKILWDFKIQTDKHLAHNIPDITVVEKKASMASGRGYPRRQQDPTERDRKDHQISRPEDRGRETMGEESHGSTSSNRSPRSNSQRSEETSEYLGPRQDNTKPTTESSTTGNNTHTAQIPLKFLGPRRGLELGGSKNSGP